jgi:predicted esterase
MKKYIFPLLFIFLINILLTAPASGLLYSKEGKDKDKLEEYNRIRTKFGQLYQQKKYSQAVVLLEKNFKRFPEKIHANCWNIAVTYIQMKKYKPAIRYLKKALDKGFWFNIWTFEGEFFKPLKKFPEFKKVVKMNNMLRDKAQKKAKPLLEVVLPADYDPEKKYPLFIALHGGGENIKVFKPHWKSEKLEKEFVVAYIQSSQVVSMTGFAWENFDVSKTEISSAFERVLKDYPVNEDEIIIGGFSSGGVASLVAVLDNVIPVCGFISLCPAKPDIFNQVRVEQARDRGVRGTILTTEMDNRLPSQKEMVSILKESGFQYQFVVTPNIGHWYPKELNKLIDQAIAHIRYK